MTLKTIASIAVLAGALACTAAEQQPEGAGLKKLGAMLDVSRGRVYKVPYLKRCFEHMSKMGYTSVMLYTEDTYRLDDVPKWGLMRGGYTKDDVREIKAAAVANGLELVPCIQTLGHLEKWLRWSDSDDVRNNGGTVLIGEPKTYELIEKMVSFWAESAGGSRIHVGMDEAYGFARDEYAKRNGERPEFDVFLEHLRKVCEICNRHGYKEVLIWNDMFYGMYRNNKDMSASEIAAKIPAGARLVLWEYRAEDVGHYCRTIDDHIALNGKPVLAGGIWVWNHFLHDRQKTLKASRAFLAGAKEKGCDEMWFTLWGDNGGFCAPESLEEGMFACAELAAGRPAEPNDDNCARFRKITGMDYRTLAKLGDSTDHLYRSLWTHDGALFYDDPLYMLEIRNILAKYPDDGDKRLRAWRDAIADAEAGSKDAGAPVACAFNRAMLARIDYSLAMLEAWKAKDAAKIKAAAAKLDKAVAAMREFNALYRDNWNGISQPFGFELVQKRNAGLLARMEEAKRRVDEYLAGKEKTIPEFDEAMKPYGKAIRGCAVSW